MQKMRACKIMWSEHKPGDTAEDVDAIMSEEDAKRFEREMKSVGEKRHAPPASNPNEGLIPIAMAVGMICLLAWWLIGSYVNAYRVVPDYDYRTAGQRLPAAPLPPPYKPADRKIEAD